MEDATQLLTGNLALVGLAYTLVGGWFAWPRPLTSGSKRPGLVNLSGVQTLFGLVAAMLGLILLVIGLASHPLY